MKTSINPSLISSPCPKDLLSKSVFISYTSSFRMFRGVSSIPRNLLVKCSSEQGENGALKNMLSGMVDKRVEELLDRKENKVLLDGLEKASQRVEMARKELAEIENQEIEAAQLRDHIMLLESRASEIAECQKEILEARLMVAEAERSLSGNMDGVGSGDSPMEKVSEEIDEFEERWESIKAAAVSAIVGIIAAFPISLTQATSSTQLILPLSITFISCALFGVTFRYAVRRDVDNVQLKTGTSAAFGFVKGLAELGAGPPLELDTGSFLSHATDGAVAVSENLFIFVFASVGLDFCFKMRLLSPFPMKKSISSTNIR